MICHHWYLKDIAYKFEPHVCNGCHDLSMMAYGLICIAILKVKGVDYTCVLWNITRNDAINMLGNSKLDDKGTLWTWILAQIKYQLKQLKKVRLAEFILETFILVLIINNIKSHGKNLMR